MSKKRVLDMIPDEGASIVASPGKKFTRIHMDLSADDGITLAMVGAATSLANKENRHSITLKPTKEGITLAMVGAASAALKK
ncbi:MULTISPECIES: hypothetical protein [Photorhabdus]|uniref:Phage tail protein n=3 Tax=Photorhabdus TaxID=29487 RepID=A0ABX0B678_9GAMM|nr:MULTISPECIES: hypothetical protein [Photorhabdus]KGM26948.1 hypothetical protein KS18_17315 [Photorhabdus luminescens]AKH64378.1 hypothetical protein VY86_14670 [Photorhabdus thracensis]MBS9431886.1 hypothetical protein [Photorhabdus hainanensis]MCC8375803.1 hypothetical protein [Photorhabdus bodei]MCC8422610.1 hypothetical protein [Photorhabdus thracensis]